MQKTVTITKAKVKNPDLIINKAGALTFPKKDIVIQDNCDDCKVKKIIMGKIQLGNMKSEIITK